MRERPFDPLHLDIRVFAGQEGVLDGEIELGQLERLSASSHPGPSTATQKPLAWQASGELRAVRGQPAQPWLTLRADALVRLTCQRCLRAVEVSLSLDNEYRFVPDETTAAALDIEAEEDVLVESRSFDLTVLIEDEMLLALPLVPRHEGPCPQPLVAPPDPVDAAIELAPADKPFAVLAGLKTRKTVD